MKSRPLGWIRGVRLWLHAVFRRRRLEDELAEEFQFHLEQQTEAFVDRGLAPDAARRKALQTFGAVETRKEECRDIWLAQTVENCSRDL